MTPAFRRPHLRLALLLAMGACYDQPFVPGNEANERVTITNDEFELEQRVGERRIRVVGVVQPVLQSPAARVVRHDVELGAIAGGEQHGFVDAVDGAHGLQRTGDLVPGEYDLLANFDRCRVMVQPEYFERHIRLRYGTGPVPGGIVHGVRIISELKAQFLVCVTHTPHYRGSGSDAAAMG